MSEARATALVIGLEDGAEGGSGPAVLACLPPARWRRIGVVAGAGEAGAYREGILDEVELLPPPGHAEFAGELARLVARHGECAVLPGSRAAAAALADWDGGTVIDSCRRDGLPSLSFTLLPSVFGPASFGYSFPCLLAGVAGRMRAGDAWEAQRAAERLARGGPVHCAVFDPLQRFEVAIVAVEGGRPLGSAAVRVLADDARLRPWAALSVDSPALLDAAGRVAAAARLEGSVTLHFQLAGRRFLCAGAEPGFPPWIELGRAAAPNLVELAARLALGAEPAPAGHLPAGHLFTQTAEDLVVGADHPVRAALRDAQDR